jgi:two-component system LytT family response regulator
MTNRVMRTLIVDDEKLARTGLRAMLSEDPDLSFDECGSGREAVHLIRDPGEEPPIDLVFLDVQMPAMNGFDVIAAVGTDHMPVVVFTTAYSEHAIQAFDACALDYLLKPVREARLAQAVARAKAEILKRRAGEPSDALPIRRVLLRSGATSYYIDVDDIDWIEADTYYARIWTGARSHLLRQSLAQLETMLDPRRFVRIHRSAIVNARKVRAIGRVALGKYCVRLHDGRQLPMSRDRRRDVTALILSSA